MLHLMFPNLYNENTVQFVSFSSKCKNVMYSKVIYPLPFYDGYIYRFMFTFVFQHSRNEKRPCLDENFCVFSCLEIEGGDISSAIKLFKRCHLLIFTQS